MDVIILDKKERPVEVRGQRYTIITFRRRAGLRSDDYGYEIKEIGVGVSVKKVGKKLTALQGMLLKTISKMKQ